MVGIEAPRDALLVETVLELGDDRAVAHAFDRLALVAFRHVGADEGEAHVVEGVGEHLVDVVDEFARDGVLVGSQTQAELRHRPVDGRPMQRRETRADAEARSLERTAGGREDGRFGIVLVDQVLQRQQVGPGRREGVTLATEMDAIGEPVGVATVDEPGAVAGRRILDQDDLTRGDGETTGFVEAQVRPGLGRAARFEGRAQAGPVEAEIGGDAGVRRDPEVVGEAEVVDGTHGREGYAPASESMSTPEACDSRAFRHYRASSVMLKRSILLSFVAGVASAYDAGSVIEEETDPVIALDDLSLIDERLWVEAAAHDAQPLSIAPARVEVLTEEDLLYSPAATLPDRLRYVPGIDVYQHLHGQFDVGLRGYNGLNTPRTPGDRRRARIRLRRIGRVVLGRLPAHLRHRSCRDREGSVVGDLRRQRLRRRHRHRRTPTRRLVRDARQRQRRQPRLRRSRCHRAHAVQHRRPRPLRQGEFRLLGSRRSPGHPRHAGLQRRSAQPQDRRRSDGRLAARTPSSA